jgi:hypothetical protein
MKKLDFYTIRNEALKYSSLSDFIKLSRHAYSWAVRHDVLVLFTWLKRDTHIWNYENVLSVAKKFSSSGAFYRRQPRRIMLPGVMVGCNVLHGCAKAA